MHERSIITSEKGDQGWIARVEPLLLPEVDPVGSNMVVITDVFNRIWDELAGQILNSSFIFGRPGEGKTVLTRWTADMCRNYGKIPVVLDLINFRPEEKETLARGNFEGVILGRLALEHFLETAYRPQKFNELDEGLKSRVVAFWRSFLPTGLELLLNGLESGVDGEEFVLAHDPHFHSFNLPSAESLRGFAQSIRETSQTAQHSDTHIERMGFLLEILKKKGLVVLVDGVKEWPEEDGEGEAIMSLLDFLAKIEGIDAKFMAFLPVEWNKLVKRRFPKVPRQSIRWKTKDLHGLIAKRVSAGVGIDASLGIICNPSVTNWNRKLATKAEVDGKPNPREMLYLLKLAIEFRNQRSRSFMEWNLSDQDFQNAINKYKKQTKQSSKAVA